MKLRVGLVVAFMLAGMAGAVGLAAPAQACSCAMGSVDDRLERADAVFTGEIVERSNGLIYEEGQPSSLGRFVYTIEVDRVYKGEVDEVQQVVAGTSGAACGVVFPKSGPILVFGNEGPGIATGRVEDGQLSTGLCDGSRTSVTVPVALGEGAAPPTGAGYLSTATTTEPDADMGQSVVSPWAIGVGAAALAGVVGVVLLRRRRPD
jgi:MYXO-CTERM domain-containing protein